MRDPNYTIKFYIGRNLMASAVIVARADKTEVSATTFGEEKVRDAATDLALLFAHAICSAPVHREILEAMLEERNMGQLLENGTARSNHRSEPPHLGDDIPF